ncbi:MULTISPECIES: hypothetical protein [unclassified Geodermatophilus]|uniref:hypothetical protein n=1 Tax=unclassified Geodermatophilus TaxID=2637632 RepID=UPI003EEA79E6
MRRIAVLSAVVLAGGLIGTSAALATADDRSADPDGRWIAVEDEVAIVLPNGDTFTDDGSMEEPEGLPPVGARVFISEVLYDTEDGTTRGAEVGRSHIECTAQALVANLRCEAAFVFTEGSQLHAAVLADFGAEESAEAFTLDVAVTGGTGTYAGATGVVTLTDISTSAEETVTRYEADLDLPRR